MISYRYLSHTNFCGICDAFTSHFFRLYDVFANDLPAVNKKWAKDVLCDDFTIVNNRWPNGTFLMHSLP